jgi:Holliday junction resolvase
MSRNYERGVKLEYRVKKFYEDLGYFVVRSAGSHSIADLVVIGYGKVYLVQCKAMPVNKIKRSEVLELIKTCEKYGAIPVLVYKKNHENEIVGGEENLLKLVEQK